MNAQWKPIPVIDLFAGPGGLGEGFSTVLDENGNPVFKVIMSIEMERTAHATLRLRAFARSIMKDGLLPDEYVSYISSPTKENMQTLQNAYPDEWKAADIEAVHGRLVVNDDTYVTMARQRLEDHYAKYGIRNFVLIGGPPCQAYSLAGRARRTHHKDDLERDVKQTLYKCYLRFIEKLRPAAFAMENVKGLLSARNYGQGVFSHIRKDMQDENYTLHSLITDNPSDPHDYIVRADEYGIPQARHRVILLGTRNDIEHPSPGTLQKREKVTVGQVLGRMPALRSGFSSRVRTNTDWAAYVTAAAERLLQTPEGSALSTELEGIASARCLPRSQSGTHVGVGEPGNPLFDWYRCHLGENKVLPEDTSRNHMSTDLDRYLFCAAFAKHNGYCAKLYDFPRTLLPNHQNVQGVLEGKNIVFPDRFHVQLANHPSTTVTSHIAKDGHYFIHPDPRQCRSLTVREAARLQTFPDDYFFEGNRTDQYRQVGNAVPPLLAQQIAVVIAGWMDRPAQGFFC